jgi:hypothetical protein
MRKIGTWLIGSGIAGLATLALTAAPAAAETPTCSDAFGPNDVIATHGQHIVGDYVTGIGHENLGWPPDGAEVGSEVAGSGAAIPGGPGPGFHFLNAVPPGASFCVDSQSPGFPPGNPPGFPPETGRP